MKPSSDAKILAGDIGGTKTVLALYRRHEGRVDLLSKQRYASRDFSDFSDIIDAFVQETEAGEIDAACFGIAGPVIGGRCRTTNLPWEIEASKLRQKLRAKNIRLLNDLEATAYGMLYLESYEFANLNPHANECDGNRAVIAAGTGLGEAMLFFDGAQYQPVDAFMTMSATSASSPGPASIPSTNSCAIPAPPPSRIL
jgi:glucokinase